MLSFSYLLERKKKLFKSISNSHNSLSFFLTRLELNYKYVHTLCSSIENCTQLQTKMGKVYTRFQNKTAQKPYPMGAHTYIAYIRENLPPRRAPCMNCRASSPSEHVLMLSLEIFQATTICRLSVPVWVKQSAYVPLTMQLVDKGLRLLLWRGFFGRKLFTSPNMTIDNSNSVLMVWDPKLKFITIAQFVLSDDFQPMPWDVSSHVSEARNARDRRRHSTLGVKMIYRLSRQHFGEKKRAGSGWEEFTLKFWVTATCVEVGQRNC